MRPEMDPRLERAGEATHEDDGVEVVVVEEEKDWGRYLPECAGTLKSCG